ncbi:MAG: pilus assembly protein N-terminal domain-containing protein, partial [Gammaproteobacteria bacterium]
MKFIFKSTIVILVLLSTMFSAQIFARDVIAGKVSLFVGDVKVLNNVSAKRIAIGKKSVLKVKVLSGKQILIIAQEVGATD